MLKADILAQAPDLHTQEIIEVGRPFTDFYDRFGRPFTDEDGTPNSELVLPPRALHVDSDVSPQHMAVHQRIGSYTLSSRRYKDPDGNYFHQFFYDSRDFIVASCDETELTQWRVSGVYGMHAGRINGIDQQYNPANEVLHFMLSHPTDLARSMTRLQFGLVHKQGTVELGGGRLGWILDEHTSRQQLERVLSAERESLAVDIGYTALAS